MAIWEEIPRKVITTFEDATHNWDWFKTKLFPLGSEALGVDSVGQSQLQANSVGTGEIQNGAVGTGDIGSLPQSRVYNNAAITGIVTSTNTALTFNSERFDSGGLHDAGNPSRLVAINPGVFMITGTIEWDSNTTGSRWLFLRVNGTTIIAGVFQVSLASLGQSISTIYKLATNDYVELCVWQNSGANRQVNSTSNYSPEFGMSWIGHG